MTINAVTLTTEQFKKADRHCAIEFGTNLDMLLNIAGSLITLAVEGKEMTASLISKHLKPCSQSCVCGISQVLSPG